MSAQPDEAPGPVPLPTSGRASCHDLVVVGCGAGGVEVLADLLAGLPTDLPAAVLVVAHLTGPGGADRLQEVLARRSALPVSPATAGAPLRRGTVLVGVPDAHLVVVDGHVAVPTGPAENGCRPAVDALLRSAASSHRSRVVGVVLGGEGDDGSAGLRAVLRHGGEAVVLDPADAVFPAMVEAALAAAPQARAVRAGALAAAVTELVLLPPAAGLPVPDAAQAHDLVETALALGRAPAGQPPGTPSAWSCPSCAGVLWEVPDGPLLRFRCPTGHAWTATALLQEQDAGVERALRTALRALEERHALAQRVGADPAPAERLLAHAAVLRRLLADGPGPVPLPG